MAQFHTMFDIHLYRLQFHTLFRHIHLRTLLSVFDMLPVQTLLLHTCSTYTQFTFEQCSICTSTDFCFHTVCDIFYLFQNVFLQCSNSSIFPSTRIENIPFNFLYDTVLVNNEKFAEVQSITFLFLSWSFRHSELIQLVLQLLKKEIKISKGCSGHYTVLFSTKTSFCMD